jgi:hypothetical protein
MTRIVLEALPQEDDGRGLYRVLESFSYPLGEEEVVIPAGFITDLCSVPAYARPFIPLAGRMTRPSIVHDYLLVIGDHRAHDIFNEALKESGVPKWTRLMMVWGVRLHWKVKSLKRKIKNAKTWARNLVT